MADTPPAPRRAPAALPSIHAVGLDRTPFQDLYHSILVRPWWQFVLFAGGAFLLLNALFALAYLLEPGSITGVRPGSFEDCFYFSVQTLGTIGYGGMTPATRYGHALVSIEAFVGMLGIAVLTGVTFAKFSRPTARVRFSARIAATPRNGVPHLMFRMANQRHNLVAEAQLRVILLVAETTKEGETMRTPIELKLVRDRTAAFFLTWTAMHEIDSTSPFDGENALENLRARSAEIYLTLTGLDETLAQSIHARYRYTLDDIAWGSRHADVISLAADGISRIIDYKNFDEVVAIEKAAEKKAV